MAAMNAGGGGAFGGMSLMNNGVNGATPRAGSDQEVIDFEARLNGYIYDFLLKTENFSTAKSMLESGVTMFPNAKERENPNGTDDTVRADSKEDMDSKRACNLPPVYPDDSSSFLLDWFSVFWDFYFARISNPHATQNTKSLLSHTQQNSRNRQEREQQLLRGTAGSMMPGGLDAYGPVLRLPNGVSIPPELRQKAIQNNRNSFGQPTAHQIAQFSKQQVQHHQQLRQQQQQQQLQRDDSELNINGQRPRSPSSAENAPSPSKRPRLDGVSNFTAQPHMMQNGRPQQGLQGQNIMTPNNIANGLLIRAGIDPKTLSAAQFNSFQNQNPSVQQKSIEVYAQTLRAQRPGLQNPGMQGQNPDLMAGIDINNSGAGPEYRFASSVGLHQSGPPVPSPAGGNHALHDYQMQLMLLEQQNKKRLLMARQEQDIIRPDGQPGMQGGQNFAPGMSPSGSRSGPSPGPNEQMKRGTPKMGQAGLPNGGSPMPDGTMPQGRDSPAAGGFNGQIPDMYSLGPGMRPPPPGSHVPFGRPQTQVTREQIEATQRNQGVGQMANATWAPGQTLIMQQQLPQTPQPSQGTPQQRAMPPPTGLPTGPTTNGRPSSPAQTPAPPTPLPAAKANPKAKKNEEKPRKRPPKKATATSAPTPAAPIVDSENPPQTPTPATPSTPSHPQSFAPKNDAHNATSLMQASIPATASAPLTQQPDSSFGGLDGDNTYEMNNPDFINGDVLENFDFDSFLQSTEDAPFNFDPAAITFANPDTVEAGGGDA